MARTKQEEDLSDLSVDELVKRRNEIIALLQTIEDEHRTAAISNESYDSAKKGNQKKLDQIRGILADFGIGDNDGKPQEKKAQAAPPVVDAVPQAPVPSSQPQIAHPIEQQQPASQEVHVQQQAPPAFSESIILDKVNAKIGGEMDKMRVLTDAIKEAQGAADERMQRITESIGELRSMLFNTDSSVKTVESKIEMLEENMAEIDPKSIEKEFMRRDKALGEHELRIEKAERRLADTNATVKEVHGIITSVGGLHNIADIDHEIAKKLEDMRGISKEIGRTAERFDKVYIELNKRMDEFFVYRAKQESLDEIVRDVIKSIDTLNSRMESAASKESLLAMRQSFRTFDGEIGKLNSKLSHVIPFADLAVPKDVQDLSSERESVKMLLSSLEEEYRSGKISKEQFMHVRDANEKKLADIEAHLRSLLEAPKSGSTPQNVSPAAVDNSAAPAIAEGKEGDSTEKQAVKNSEEVPKPGNAVVLPEATGHEPKESGARAGKSPENSASPIEAEGNSAENNPPLPAASPKQPEEQQEDLSGKEKEQAIPSGSVPANVAEKEHTEPKVNKPDKKERLILQLDDSYKSGHLSRQAYEHAKSLILKAYGK